MIPEIIYGIWICYFLFYVTLAKVKPDGISHIRPHTSHVDLPEMFDASFSSRHLTLITRWVHRKRCFAVNLRVQRRRKGLEDGRMIVRLSQILYDRSVQIERPCAVINFCVEVWSDKIRMLLKQRYWDNTYNRPAWDYQSSHIIPKPLTYDYYNWYTNIWSMRDFEFFRITRWLYEMDLIVPNFGR